MTQKWRTFLMLILIPVWVTIHNVLVPFGTSQIIGKLSDGDFEIANYVDLLLLTFLPAFCNNMIIVRILDWVDWSIDAKCGGYLARKSFDAVINQSMTFHNNHFSGSLTSQANKFVSAFIDLKSNFVWNIYPLIFGVISSVISAFLVCPPFAWILICFTTLYAAAAIITYYKTTDRDEKMANAEHKQTGQLADSITNMVSVKSYAREKYEKGRYAKDVRRVHDATMGLAKISLMRNTLLNGIGFVTFVLTLILVILSHNLFGLSIASMVFLYTLSNTLLSTVWQLNHILRVVNRAFGNAKEMTEILDLPYIIDDKTDKPLVIKKAAVNFEDITFQHEKQKGKLFANFSLEIEPGQSVGLVGVSGSGKSTLTKLLLRFDDVKAGAILVDGQDIRDVTQASLREAIAYVPQESSLFHRSVFENIAYGRPEASDAEVYEAARLANADEFIKNLPEGYDTMVGERGVKLSGGQRQRIAIARAILKNAPILVLDEATSALDSESEAAIQGALANLMKGKTSIVVAHRLSTIAGLDKIVVLNDGVIVEQGSHKELLKAGGAYAKLWGRQSGAFLDEE